MKNPEKWLKIAFLAGAALDGAAAVAMVVPSLSQPVWGLAGLSGEYRFAMGYGASLMAGWTALLYWASRRPLERRFVALLTVVPVLAGLIWSELYAWGTGLLLPEKLLALLVMQHLAILVLGTLYHRTRARS